MAAPEGDAVGLDCSRRVSAGVVAAMVVGRLVAVVGFRPYVYFDSGEYDIIDFTGGSRRPWATPLFYALVPGDDRWEVVAQAMLGGVAWGVLVLVVVRFFTDRRASIAAGVLTAMIGLTTSVTNWDTAMLSESVALSTTVLLVAAWLHLVWRDTWSGVALVAAATVPWIFTRQSLVPTALVVGVAAAITAATAAWHGRPWRRWGAAALAVLVLVGLVTASYARNQEIVQNNLTVILANRVAPDADRRAWFLGHGMPVPPSGAMDFGSLESDAAFQDWVSSEGRSTYVRYLVSHPWYTLTEPLDDLVSVRRSYGDEPIPDVAMLSPADSYGSARAVLPEVAERLVFGPGESGTVVAALAGLGGLSLLARRERDRRWVLALGLVAVSLVSMIGGWHGATPELNRLAIVAAVTLRIGLVLQGALLLEAWLRRRSMTGAVT